MNTEKAFNFDEFRAPPPSRLTKFRWWLRRRFPKRADQKDIDHLFHVTTVPYVEDNLPEIHEEIWAALYRVDPRVNYVWAVFVTTIITRVMALEAEVKALKEGKNPHGFLH